MCGRYTLRFPRKVTDVLLPAFTAVTVGPRYNIAPGQKVLVIRTASTGGGDAEVDLLEWGWPPPPGVKARVVNARVEKVASGAFFRDAFQSRRCLLPADGFYEWEKRDGMRLPFFISLRDDRPFALAALWTEDGEGDECVTVITVPANSMVESIHSRMPAILSPEAASSWLRPSSGTAQDALDLLVPFPAEEMQLVRVSSRMNSPKMDDPSCVEPDTGKTGNEQLEWDFDN